MICVPARLFDTPLNARSERGRVFEEKMIIWTWVHNFSRGCAGGEAVISHDIHWERTEIGMMYGGVAIARMLAPNSD